MDRRFGGVTLAMVVLGIALGPAASARERAPRRVRGPAAGPPLVARPIGQHRQVTGHVAYFTVTAQPTRYPPYPMRNVDPRHEFAMVEGFYWIVQDDTGKMQQFRLGGSGGSGAGETTDDQVAGRMAALLQAYRDGRVVTIDCVNRGGALCDIVRVSGEARAMPVESPAAVPAPEH